MAGMHPQAQCATSAPEMADSCQLGVADECSAIAD